MRRLSSALRALTGRPSSRAASRAYWRIATGISWVRPTAPASLTAFGLPLDIPLLSIAPAGRHGHGDPMLARVRSGALRGIDALVVDVEVDVSSGLPHTTTVGLPDGAVREGTERIRAALRNCGFKHAERRVTVNLGPAGVRKEGAAFDLPIALGLLAAFGDFDLPDLSRWCVLGELGLDGRVHGVRGALPIAAAAWRARLGGLLVPAANAAAALAGAPAGHRCPRCSRTRSRASAARPSRPR